MSTESTPREVPGLTPAGPLVLPERAERTLPNGLKVIAIRRSSIPLVELRLRVPLVQADLAQAGLLAGTLFAGTDEMDIYAITTELQAVGGGLAAGTDMDRLTISGNCLVDGLDRLLELLAITLNGAVYPEGEVETEAERIADRISLARTQPGHLARVALLKRIYPGHPYEVQTPEPEQVRAVTREQLAAMHAERVRPEGATLVLVGDVVPEKALDSVAQALSAWTGPAPTVTFPAVPALGGGPITLVDRPGSVQSCLRIALPGVPRSHPDHPALTLANLVFGGYFSSRLVGNIREDKGYTYSPHSGVEHSLAGSTVMITADVATEVTAPALLETLYELGRMSVLPPEAEELEQAREYALGSLRLGMATQAGIASLTSMLEGFGLDLDWLAAHCDRLANTTLEQVAAASARYLAPANAAIVILGEADVVEPSLRALAGVVRA
ncbi:peptidase M16 [Longispora fulva]|uniref:Putative Zn-dependent peptidase n=1 Tax=Longispora fulva TaxID=619741 RepID=A0A8J7KM51_9ACTN|nr:pitrilysin family protein [Longispora fulva]MBG6138771.1 putative Zn-dependent peptidase [Longispora fulva]GIG58266.1 peptidase M16 [Longispora fulva]